MPVCPSCQVQYDAAMAFCPKDGTHLTGAPASSAAGSGGRLSPIVAGQVVADRYRLLRKIGSGGMGDVYEARHVYIEKTVALKLLRQEILSPEAVARFQQEARAASRIGHENIVDVEDFGRLPDGSVYLAMEYLEGESLDAAIRRDLLPLPRAIDIMCQVCRGLAAAHGKGIIHRDVKPENIFLVARGGRDDGRDTVKILDFGIAKVVAAESGVSGLTQTGAIFGTPHYMSPEQAMGKELNPKSDVYSCGVILYQLLTGLVPFKAETFMGVLTQHINAAPVAPSELAPDRGIPAVLEAVVLRALAKDPGHRQGSMADLQAALESGRAALGGTQAVLHVAAGQAPPAEGLHQALMVTATPGRAHAQTRDDNDNDAPVAPAAGRGRWLAAAGVVALIGAAVAALAFVKGRASPPAAAAPTGGSSEALPARLPATAGAVPLETRPPPAHPPSAATPPAEPPPTTTTPPPTPKRGAVARPAGARRRAKATGAADPYELLDKPRTEVLDPYK